ncbi:ABC transporter ATP-binding protein [Halomicroarcula sp. GCM10025709]|uniref:ABC transporter ATP-binding protein n=1 Tax=Haloarcula TaxID=2237 RepID=UPI0024C2144B|nr:ABC transporter ATP-binding protein [Halomicroarcula sp. YJ-61-S]
MTLELTRLAKSYGSFDFGPVDLTVGQEVLALLGPSGSGKTTLLSLITGITSPDTGSISLDGRALSGVPLEARRVGMVFQDGALFPHMTARENVAYAGADGDRIRELAALLELDGVLDRTPDTLSGGERQRVALARTLAADPDALLLDEPLSSLDAPIRRRLREELHGLFDSLSIPVVYVTHDQRTATALGDRLAILRDGGLEQVGPPPSVLDRPANRFVARFTGNENRFDGHVTERTDDGALVQVGEKTLRTAVVDPPADAVTVCLHPSRVTLHTPGAAPDPEAAGKADGFGTANVLTGTVTRWLNEGTSYRVAVECGPLTVTATVHPPVFDRLSIDTGETVRVSLPRESIHLLGAGEAP